MQKKLSHLDQAFVLTIITHRTDCINILNIAETVDLPQILYNAPGELLPIFLMTLL